MNVAGILIAILKYGLSPIVLVILGIFIALHYQEEIQKYSVFFWKIIGIFWKKAEKKIVSNDIESRVNKFTKSLKQEMANFEPIGVQIQWVEEGESPSEFFSDGRLIIRMREHQNQNKNFVYASMVFISKAVLTKAKRYISKTQKESLDLFIGKKLFEKEKPQIIDQFFEDFFSPKMDVEKIGELVEKYTVLDKTALFFPVLVQELTFLGEKVFWKRRDDIIITEVNRLIGFLEDYANREVGVEELPKYFDGVYCRCSIVIIGKYFRRELRNIDLYTNHIDSLTSQKIENVYIIGPASKDNVEFIDKIVRNIEQRGLLEKYTEPRVYKAEIKSGGRRKLTDRYILLLRNPNAVRYFDEEYQKQFIEPSLKNS
jgi:hypothetical protein